MFAKKNTILITGGAGFIGHHLSKALYEEGHNVIVVDSLITGSEKNIPYGVDFINGDICDIGTIPYKFDEIYNLACPASPVHYQAHPLETLKANTIGIINLLEFAKKIGAKILHTSTSEVYGDPLEHPQKETYWGHVNCFGPRSCYDEGKRVAEALCYSYLDLHKVRVKIVRIFNTYGPNMQIDDGRVVSNFITQCLRNEPITVYGDGEQTRSFCYVDDMVDGLTRLMRSSDEVNYPINLGNPGEYTMIELARLIKALTKSESAIRFVRMGADDPRQRKPDISLAERVLNWRPSTHITEGLPKTIEYFREVLS